MDLYRIFNTNPHHIEASISTFEFTLDNRMFRSSEKIKLHINRPFKYKKNGIITSWVNRAPLHFKENFIADHPLDDFAIAEPSELECVEYVLRKDGRYDCVNHPFQLSKPGSQSGVEILVRFTLRTCVYLIITDMNVNKYIMLPLNRKFKIAVFVHIDLLQRKNSISNDLLDFDL